MKRTLVVAAALALMLASDAAAADVTYSYDAAGRLVRVDYGNGKGYVYRWDAMGNLVAREPLPPGPNRRRAVRAAARPRPAVPRVVK